MPGTKTTSWIEVLLYIVPAVGPDCLVQFVVKVVVRSGDFVELVVWVPEIEVDCAKTQCHFLLEEKRQKCYRQTLEMFNIIFISGNCDDLQLATAQLSLQANTKQIASSTLFKVAFGSCLSLLRYAPPALNSCQSSWLWKRSVIHQRLTPRNQALRIESRSTLNGAARPSFKMAGKGRTCWRDYLKLNLNFQPSSLEKVYTKWLTYLSG